jgi:hypothetical protein
MPGSGFLPGAIARGIILCVLRCEPVAGSLLRLDQQGLKLPTLLRETPALLFPA